MYVIGRGDQAAKTEPGGAARRVGDLADRWREYRVLRRRPGCDQGGELTRAVEQLQLPEPFTLEGLGESLGHYLGREVYLNPFSVGLGEASGFFLRTAGVDRLCYQTQTSPFHQAHTVAYLAGQALLNDPARPTVDPRLVPHLGIQLIRLILGADTELAEVADDGHADVFAMRLLARAGICECQAREARRLHRALAPLHEALAGVVPEAVRPRPAGVPGSARFRLYWRVVEIRDAMLALRPYRDQSSATARGATNGHGNYSDDAALTEARLLASGLTAKRAGWLPRPATTLAGQPGASIDMRADARWLARVAQAFAQGVK
jgi:hypothetical protein